MELHLHLVGSASPATLAGLAARRPGSGVPADPHMCGTDLDEEYRRLAATFGGGVDDLAALVRAGVAASLQDDAAKRRLLADVDAAAGG